MTIFYLSYFHKRSKKRFLFLSTPEFSPLLFLSLHSLLGFLTSFSCKTPPSFVESFQFNRYKNLSFLFLSFLSLPFSNFSLSSFQSTISCLSFGQSFDLFLYIEGSISKRFSLSFKIPFLWKLRSKERERERDIVKECAKINITDFGNTRNFAKSLRNLEHNQN